MKKLTARQKEIERLEELLEFYKAHSTIEDLSERYAVSVPTIFKWIRVYEDFPRKSEILLGRRGLRNTQEVDEWLASKRLISRPHFGVGRQ